MVNTTDKLIVTNNHQHPKPWAEMIGLCWPVMNNFVTFVEYISVLLFLIWWFPSDHNLRGLHQSLLQIRHRIHRHFLLRTLGEAFWLELGGESEQQLGCTAPWGTSCKFAWAPEQVYSQGLADNSGGELECISCLALGQELFGSSVWEHHDRTAWDSEQAHSDSAAGAPGGIAASCGNHSLLYCTLACNWLSTVVCKLFRSWWSTASHSSCCTHPCTQFCTYLGTLFHMR